MLTRVLRLALSDMRATAASYCMKSCSDRCGIGFRRDGCQYCVHVHNNAAGCRLSGRYACGVDSEYRQLCTASSAGASTCDGGEQIKHSVRRQLRDGLLLGGRTFDGRSVAVKCSTASGDRCGTGLRSFDCRPCACAAAGYRTVATCASSSAGCYAGGVDFVHRQLCAAKSSF